MRCVAGVPGMELLIALVVVCGCTRNQRPYDTIVTCRDPGAPLIETVEEAVARLDLDADGTLTDLDLRERESRAVIRLEGVHEATGQASEPGVSLHADLDTQFYFNPYFELPTWNVDLALNCMPVGAVALLFQSDDGDENLEIGSYPAFWMSVDVWTHEMQAGSNFAPPEVVGTVHITDTSANGISGWFEGRATGALHTSPPERKLTGQSLTVEALAFREVPVT